MSGRLRRLFTPSAQVTAAPPPWSRQRLVVVLGILLAAALVMVFGLGLGLYYSFKSHHGHSASPTGSATESASTGGTTAPSASASAKQQEDTAAEDRLAAAAMPKSTLSDAQPGAPISAKDPGQLVLPRAKSRDALGVSTGFPHTPAGALAAVASIDATAFDTGSMSGVRSVIKAWAVPGGPTTSTWSGVKAMASFFDAAGLFGGGSQSLSMVTTPVMGLIKGTVGPNFVVGCVDFELDATLNQTQRVAVADCERMVWTGGKWMVGAGDEPAEPPSVWPDTDLAIKAGYEDLVK